jgi:inner membrane organizing system protein 1
MQSTNLPSQEILARKFDKTLSSFVINTGFGLAAGAFFSLILFKRKAWPIALGTGFGLGTTFEESKSTFDLYRERK